MVSAFSAALDDRYAAQVPRCGNCGPVAQASDPVPLEMFTIRGCADRRSAGRKTLVTATTPKTFVS